MPPPLPLGLSPHVVVQTSPDLDELLASRGLPSLAEYLGAFSPLQQVTTRTSGLVPVPHNNFNIRFSSLQDIERACREDEERRAGRTIDWIGTRVSTQAAKWVSDPESRDKEHWWSEVKDCVEGDNVPVRGEGWNHPTTLIVATSTLAPNPLQTITNLHSRQTELPPWVDGSMFKYTLIVHPTPSNLNPDEAVALLNAVKKQHGLNTHLLQLPALPGNVTMNLPRRLPRLPVPIVPANYPYGQVDSIPPPSEEEDEDLGPSNHVPTSLSIPETDAQNTSRFVREFVTMALIPWMERCVSEWNESFSSTRRLPTRILSSTARRFFGGSISASPSPAPSPLPSTVSLSSPTLPTGQSAAQNVQPPSTIRRLAEFSTILGDYKLATAVWDTLRKESTASLATGVEILPLLLAPTPSVLLGSHANAALAPLKLMEGGASASAQVRALRWAVWWSVGVRDFERVGVDGEKWLASAAGLAEEPSSALLLARAATISYYKGSKRRAALWYAVAARTLEKSGIKPLTIYFFERANEAYVSPKDKSLSPSFYAIEAGIMPSEGDDEAVTRRAPAQGKYGFDGIQPFIEHALGRLKYSNGDILGAIQVFAKLLRKEGSIASGGVVGSEASAEENDRMYLEDFRVAFEHLLSTASTDTDANVDLNVKFFRPSEIKVNLHGDGHPESEGDLEGHWRAFRRASGEKDTLDVREMALVEEPFDVELALFNPLDAEVMLTDVTLVIDHSALEEGTSASDVVDIEVLDVILGPKESKSISLRVTPKISTTLTITHASYMFLSLVRISESLASRGKRLNDTVAQRRGIVYAPDVFAKVEVRKGGGALHVEFLGGNDGGFERTDAFEGECIKGVMRVKNVGDKHIGEVWVVGPLNGDLWIDGMGSAKELNGSTLSWETGNAMLASAPLKLKGVSVAPGDSYDCNVIMRYSGSGRQTLSALVVFREDESIEAFRATRVKKEMEVQPLLGISVSTSQNDTLGGGEVLSLQVENLAGSSGVHIAQISSVSSAWSMRRPHGSNLISALGDLAHRQISRSSIEFDLAESFDRSTQAMDELSVALSAVIGGKGLKSLSKKEDVQLFLSHRAVDEHPVFEEHDLSFVRSTRRTRLERLLAVQFPSIPSSDYSVIFPLYTTADVDLVLRWSLPSKNRWGLVTIPDVSIGPQHGALRMMVAKIEEGGQTNSMYAETVREREALIRSIKESHWNMEKDPVSIVVASTQRNVKHDFDTGPLLIPIELAIQNHSFTHHVRYSLTFTVPPSARPGYSLPINVGNLTHHGAIPPSGKSVVQVQAMMVCAGMYDVGGYQLAVNVGRAGEKEWETMSMYTQSAAWGAVVDVSETQ